MPELRRDPLSGKWIIMGSQRTEDFFKTLRRPSPRPARCPFCEGNESQTLPEIFALRSPKSKPNGPGWKVRVVPSKQAAVFPNGDLNRRAVGMYDAMNVVGRHELIMESPRHIKNLSELSASEIEKVVAVWAGRIRDLREEANLRYALLFKNQRPHLIHRVGHAHSQLAALPATPKSIKDELLNCREYFERKERCLLCDMVREETAVSERVIFENQDCVSFVPYASRFPFECWILPKRHNPDFSRESPKTLNFLSRALRETLLKIEKALSDPWLSLVLHTIPFLRPYPGYWTTIQKDYHWHFEIYPHVLESTAFESGTGFHIQPLTSENCAAKLRDV